MDYRLFYNQIIIVIMTVKDCMTPPIPHNLVLAGMQGSVNNTEQSYSLTTCY